MTEMARVLLSWAVLASHYPEPSEPPRVEFKPHAFFVENVCLGKPCNALGWYNDQGVVYLDERIRNPDNPESRSIWIHEFVHYLQHKSGKYASQDCNDKMAREKEAYAIQNRYLAGAYGFSPFLRLKFKAC
jgi:hypothetical protein